MRSREIQHFLASISGRTSSEIDQRCRPLREALKIPSGPRGLSAPHMDLGSGMLHVLAMAAARPADALAVAIDLMECRLHHSDIVPELSSAFEEHNNLAVFFLSAMDTGYSSLGFDIISFELQDDGKVAWMNFNRRSLKGLRFCFSHSPSVNSNDYERLSASNRFVIGRRHLEVLGAQILRDCPRPHDDAEAEEDVA